MCVTIDSLNGGVAGVDGGSRTIDNPKVCMAICGGGRCHGQQELSFSAPSQLLMPPLVNLLPLLLLTRSMCMAVSVCRVTGSKIWSLASNGIGDEANSWV